MSPSRNDIRNDINDAGLDEANTTTIPCPFCQNAFTPIRSQKYATPPAARHPGVPATTLPRTGGWPAGRDPATRHHRQPVPECGTRSPADQWYPDCTQPAPRIDVGGLPPLRRTRRHQ